MSASTRLDRHCEANVQGMHPFTAKDIDGFGERPGHRGHENREAPVVRFFNNQERRDASFLNLGQRRLPLHGFEQQQNGEVNRARR